MSDLIELAPRRRVNMTAEQTVHDVFMQSMLCYANTRHLDFVRLEDYYGDPACEVGNRLLILTGDFEGVFTGNAPLDDIVKNGIVEMLGIGNDDAVNVHPLGPLSMFVDGNVRAMDQKMICDHEPCCRRYGRLVRAHLFTH